MIQQTENKENIDLILAVNYRHDKLAIELTSNPTISNIHLHLAFVGVPNSNQWKLDNQASYIYYCANETVHGVEFHEPIEHNPDIPLVTDMSSNMLTRSLDISKVCSV